LAGTGIRKNPSDSGGFWSKYRNSCPAGIPAKNPVKVKKNRNSCDPLQNHVPMKKISGKHRKKIILRNPVRNCFLGPNIKFLKTRICNLAPPHTIVDCGVVEVGNQVVRSNSPNR
jgi:hypothetical protein